MEESLNTIAQAIIGLHSNPIKDYIFPILSPLLSAALGAWAAFYAVNTQEHNRMQIKNVDALNETMLSANEVRNSLMSIKDNYYKSIGKDPFQRMLTVPPVILNGGPIQFSISSLVFITQVSSNRVNNRWLRIEYIESLFKNYNNVLAMWQKRNEIMHEIMPHIMQFYGKPVSLAELVDALGQGPLAMLSDLTEQVLMITDDLLVEISCFLVGFPEVSKDIIPKKIKNNFRSLLTIQLPDNEDAINLLSIIPELDFEMASKIHNITAEEVKSRYRRLYLK